MQESSAFRAERFLKSYPPKAAQLIVTIYGDIVEPRGGVLWMGNLISLCSGFGVNESLVRTAVSRLVSKGQLSGERDGRRSFYALTEEARNEYHLAADLFFGPSDSDCDWIISVSSVPAEQDKLLRAGFVNLGGNVFIAADRHDRPLNDVSFRSSAEDPNSKSFRTLLRSSFKLDELSDEYMEFTKRYQPMDAVLEKTLSDQEALLCRLALVHDYRAIRFRDPRLPPGALPVDWPGHDAHRLFAVLYAGLSEAADNFIGQHLMNQAGLLGATPAPIKSRLETISKRI
ncbi:PaaX family transcriptional regulator C-terminal domain-containing protein [uncultured Roseibium sp.]|uniref:PaaX family transcriptional regulator n=1 Tax=uncultured Roseibium sp. TaxID=1936171 RepID=UPI00260BCDD8|nr:PaaX family transcriptional regulator C-terminal domain-containing protein [uncultured Roseibium sp.]